VREAITTALSAPVAVLMFNRPDVTKATLARVLEAQPRAVYLIADGPRPDHPADVELCEQVRSIATSLDWACPVYTLFAEANLGLRKRVSTGLDWVFAREDRAIVVEDDCLADPSFFPFATQLLERYSSSPEVGIISGNNFLRGRRVSDDSYFFSPDARIWGWATWARVWSDFSHTGLGHQWTEVEAEHAVARLDSPARRRALLFDAKRAHLIDSWALPFVLHFQRRGLLSVVPTVNLVTNVGFGEGSTHTKFESFTAEIPASAIEFPLTHPATIQPTPGVGALERRLALLQWLVFPLRHPLDFAGRVWRYLRGRLTARA
jgi:hypothetical protein